MSVRSSAIVNVSIQHKNCLLVYCLFICRSRPRDKQRTPACLRVDYLPDRKKETSSHAGHITIYVDQIDI